MSVASCFSKRALHTLALTLATLFALSTSLAVSASGGSLKQISSDPYKNPSSQHQTEVEPDSFAHGSTIVAAFQSGRFTNGGSSNNGWATSTDGGKTWTHGFLPNTTVYAKPKGIYARATDPAVAYDVKFKQWLIVSLMLDNTGTGVAVLVSRSADGLKWGKPVTVKVAKNGEFYDKTWIVCDNSAKSKFGGNCYIESDNHGNGNLIQMSTSTDGGATWAAPLGTKDGAFGIGGQPLVKPDGLVIVPIDDAFESSLLAFTSNDGGKSWSSTITVTTFQKFTPGGGLRAPDLISAAMDKAGKVYVVFYDCRFESGCTANDLVMTTTTDGKTWTKVKRIPADKVGSGVDHFIPGIGIDPTTAGKTAHIVIAFYYYKNANCGSNCVLNIGYVSSTNGGKTWTTTTPLATGIQLSWLAQTTQGPMVGDYIATSFSGGKAYPVVATASAPKGGVFNEVMATSINGLDALGGNDSSNADHVYSAHPVPSILQHAN